MNFIKRWLIEKGAQHMITKVWGSLQGHKTNLLSLIGVIVAVAAHFWGPFNIGDLVVPEMSWNQVWGTIWTGGLFSALHAKK